MFISVHHRVDGLEKLLPAVNYCGGVHHRVDGLEIALAGLSFTQKVHHRVDGLEMSKARAGLIPLGSPSCRWLRN